MKRPDENEFPNHPWMNAIAADIRKGLDQNRKQRKLEALIARPGTDGERAAAQNALARLNSR